MNRKNIACGVEESGLMWKGHFGISPYFDIYDENKIFVERRLNPYGTASGSHNHHDNPMLIIEFLSDCGIFVAKRMGQESIIKLEEKFGIKPIITELLDSKEVMKLI